MNNSELKTQLPESKKGLAFDKTNFILLAIGMAIIILGFLLMTVPVRQKELSNPIFLVYAVSR